MESTGEFGLNHTSELLTSKEIERAINGVEEFKQVFAKCNLRQRRILRHGEIAQHLQNTFLGIKPVSVVSSAEKTLRGLPLPERFKADGDYLYDRDLVAEKIAQNSDIFPDYPGTLNLDEYIKSVIRTNPVVSTDPDRVKKIGLLLGFPKDAVMSYADNMRFYRETLRFFHDQAEFIFNHETGFSNLEKDIIFHLAHVDKKGHVQLGELDGFLDRYGPETKAFLEDWYAQMRSVTDDQINYIVENRAVSVRGIDYGTGVPTRATLLFPKKVQELYNISGMTSVLKSTRLLHAVK